MIIFDQIAQVLKWVAEYGANTVFMVWFFILYWRANKRNERLQDERLGDSKIALEALIEAKHVFTEMSETQDKLHDDIREHFADDTTQFNQLNSKLDLLVNRRKAPKDKDD